MQITKYDGEGFKAVLQSECWRIGLLRWSIRFSKADERECHDRSDEAFVLLQGKATLYENEDSCEMRPGLVYNIPKGTWHHITVSRDALVLVVENSDVGPDNTRKMPSPTEQTERNGKSIC